MTKGGVSRNVTKWQVTQIKNIQLQEVKLQETNPFFTLLSTAVWKQYVSAKVYIVSFPRQFFKNLLILNNYLTVILYLFYIQYKCDCYTFILLIKHSNFFRHVKCIQAPPPKKKKQYYTVITPLLLANESFRKDVTTGLSTAFSFSNFFIPFVRSAKQSSVYVTAVAKTGIWSS